MHFFLQKLVSSHLGIEPRTFGLEVQRAIRCANGTVIQPYCKHLSSKGSHFAPTAIIGTVIWYIIYAFQNVKKYLHDRESNLGLPRDRQRSSLQDYQGLLKMYTLI